MRIVSIILLSISLIQPASGNWAQSGAYWYYGGGSQAYNRFWVPAYYNGGCCVRPGYYRYAAYTPPVTQTQTVTINLPNYGPNWRPLMIDAAVKLDDYRSFDQAFQLLRPAVEAVQQQPQYSRYGSYSGSTYVGPSGQYGATIIGQTVRDYAIPYDPNLATQAYFQGVNAIGPLHARIQENAKEVISYEIEMRKHLGTIERINAGVIGQQKAAITTIQGSYGPSSQVSTFRHLRHQRCAACHTKEDFLGWDNLSAAEYANIVLQRLTTSDPDRRMPRIPDGTPRGRAGTLVDAEIQIFQRR